jgi:pimeloyl-ACP methyl ester carboxylesterase
MPYLEREGARLFFEDEGAGPPILTTHGLAENHLYWRLPSVSQRLAGAGYRVISMDMRAHGRSRSTGEPRGYDVETMAADIGALADHLGLERFHLLTHATGGMCGLRYAMGDHQRLLSLMCTNTGSATAPTDEAADSLDPAATFAAPSLGGGMAQAFRGRTWYQFLKGAREGARDDIFLNSLHLAVDPEAAFSWYETCSRLGDPDAIADFASAFYSDPNPHIARLRGISCPCLVLVGENDRLFLAPSRQLAREIPDAKFVVLDGRGHMTAFEDPERTTAELLIFLRELSGRQTSVKGAR